MSTATGSGSSFSGRGEDASPAPSGWVEALVFAVAAAVVIELARLVAGFPDDKPTWFARNLSLFVLPFLAAYFARRRQLDRAAGCSRPRRSCSPRS